MNIWKTYNSKRVKGIQQASEKRPILTTAFSIIYLGTDIPIFSPVCFVQPTFNSQTFFFGDISLTTLASLTCIYNLVQEEKRTNL